MNLVSAGDRRSFKKCKSYVRERAGLRSSGGKILSLHKREIGARRAKSNTIALIVGPHTFKIVSPCYPALEMVDA